MEKNSASRKKLAGIKKIILEENNYKPQNVNIQQQLEDSSKVAYFVHSVIYIRLVDTLIR